MYKPTKWRILSAVSVAAAALAGCHDDHGNNAGAIPPPPPAVSFTTFATNTFAANANNTPVSLDGVAFNFDADNSPGTFDALLMSGMF